MKDILIGGHRILTTDDIADAVLSYARVLIERRTADIVEFPSIHDGSPTLCSLLLGGTGLMAVVDAPVALAAPVGGADLALDEITRRADAIELRKRLWDEATEHVVTRDGVESVVTELPNSKAVRDLADAVERLTRVAEHAAGGAQDATAEAISMLGRLQAQMRQKDSDT